MPLIPPEIQDFHRAHAVDLRRQARREFSLALGRLARAGSQRMVQWLGFYIGYIGDFCKSRIAAYFR